MSSRLFAGSLRLGVCALMFGLGALSCQTATTGAKADNLRNAGEVETPATSREVDGSSSQATLATPLATTAAGTSPRVVTSTEVTTSVPLVTVPQRLHELTIESDELGTIPVLVRVPAHRSDQLLPVLFVLHGRGEAVKGPDRGVRAFLDDYGLERVWTWLERKTRGSLPDASITDSYRAQVAARLEQHPFHGMILVMPYLPDRFRAAEAFEKAKPYAAVLRQTANKLKQTFAVASEPSRWALDGISLGGRVAFLCGPMLTDIFGAVGGVQAAIDEREFAALVELMARSKGHPTPHYFLATSEQDYYRSVLQAFHQYLEQNHLSHSFTTLPGDHSYSFNRGPGLTYLLLTYDAFLNP